MRERVFQCDYLPGVAPYWYKSGTTYVYNTPKTYAYSSKYRGTLDIVTEDFRAKCIKGEIVNNPFYNVYFTLNQQPTVVVGSGVCSKSDSYEKGFLESLDFPLGGRPGVDFGLQLLADTVLAPFTSEADGASAQAWANVNVSEAAALASLGELPETVTFLIDVLKAIAQLTLAAKQGDWRKVLKAARKAGTTVDGVGNIWLAYRYAVRPLFFEYQQIMAALSKTVRTGIRQTARGSSKLSLEPKSEPFDREIISKGIGWTDSTRVSGKIERSYNLISRAGVLFEIERDINAMLAVWGLDDPFGAMWELIPCSFIADWIINIGDVLNAATSNPGLTARASWVTQSIHYHQSVVVDRCYTTGYNCNMSKGRVATQLGNLQMDIIVKRRVPLAERYTLPRVKLKLDFAKLTDLYLISRKLL